VALASRGRRETETGTEAVADGGLAAQLRRQAAAVHRRAALAAAALTALSLAP
jgi:hypothetical protein